MILFHQLYFGNIDFYLHVLVLDHIINRHIMYNLIHSLQLGDTVTCIDSNEQFIAAGSLSGLTYVWNVEDIKEFKNQLFIQTVPALMGVTDCKFDKNGNQLFVSTLDSTIRKYHLDTENTNVTDIPADLMSKWKLDLNGSTLMTCGEQGKVTIYDKTTLLKQSEIKGGDAFLNCIYRMRDGHILSVGNSEGNIILFNLQKNNKQARFPIHKQIVRDVKIIQSKSYAVSCSDDSLVKVFDINKQQTHISLSQHTKSVTSLDIHPKQDHLLVTGGLDKLVRVWDLRQKNTVCKIDTASEIWSIKYWKTGRSILVGTEDGTFSIFSL